MRSFVPLLGLLIFMLIVVLAAGSKFAEAKASVDATSKCSRIDKALELCK